MRDQETKALFQAVCLRVGKLLKHLLPRHRKADILYGTGSPDTTGYLYGAYGVLSAALGPKVTVTPDFEQAVLEGSISVSGHFLIVVLLFQVLKILLDRNFRHFIEKLKAGRK